MKGYRKVRVKQSHPHVRTHHDGRSDAERAMHAWHHRNGSSGVSALQGKHMAEAIVGKRYGR